MSKKKNQEQNQNQNLEIVLVSLEKIKGYENNPKSHPQSQIEKIKKSIEAFGFVNPVLVGENSEIIAGHGRVLAAKELGMKEVPAIFISYLSENQKKALRIADNKTAESDWDVEKLLLELSSLQDLDESFFTGFDSSELEKLFGDSKEIDFFEEEEKEAREIDADSIDEFVILLKVKIEVQEIFEQALKELLEDEIFSGKVIRK